MSTDLIYWLFNMSLSASVMGLVILLLGKFRALPRSFLCFLWIIPFLRMWIPVGIRSRWSLFSLISLIPAKSVPVPVIPDAFATMNHAQFAQSYFPVVYKMYLLERVFLVAQILWFLVASALLILIILTYRSAGRTVRRAAFLRENLYCSDEIRTPAVFGILRPVILLPKSCGEDTLKYVLLHERAHIRRRDNLWRLAAVVTACVHWFNPLSWVFLRAFLESLELACDEAVLKQCSPQERKEYAGALLRFSESRSLPVSAFGGAKASLRIRRILSYRKLSLVSSVSLAVFALAAAFVLLTNPV